MSSAANPVSTSVLTLPKAILWGGFVAGVLDAVDGVVAFGTKGLNPIQVLQYIASGLLGPSSFNGGLGTAALGTALHFFIAFVAAAVYVLASAWMPVLKSKAILFGLLFGAAVYFFMNYLVLPLSTVAHTPFFSRPVPKRSDRTRSIRRSADRSLRKEDSKMSDQGNPSTTVVLAHAAWADGSSWNKVIPPLQHLGLNVVSAQIPLTWSRASGRRGHLGLSIPLTCLG